ncbi:MAG TPA: glycine oxidase ThiO [Pyrinomonadaceae bacterium]
MNPEVLIIGGGVIGLTIARELVRRGVERITVVERGTIGAEASWAAAGMLAPNIEAPLSDGFHRFCSESLDLYPDLSDELLSETGIDIELDRSGTICIALTENDAAHLPRHGGERLSGAEIFDIEPALSRQVPEGILFRNDWQVENRKLMTALRRSAENRGIRLLEHTEVSELLTDGNRVTGARTSKGDLNAETTVLATGAWTSLIKIGTAAVGFDVKPIKGQMAAFETGTGMLRHVVFSPRGYLVPRANGRLLVGATVEDVGFDKSITVEGIDSLTRAAFEMAPGLTEFAVVETWAGLRPFAADALPVIGPVPGFEDVIVATAHYRNGILLAPCTARIVADKIVDGGHSDFFDLFRPDRFSRMATNAGY